MSVNKFIGIGRVTRDPETKYLPSGEAVTNLSIACNEKWKNKDGEQQEKVEYINLTFYRRLAEVAGEYIKKGAMIYVEGRIQTRKWQDKEGKDRYTTEIIVNEMKMLGGKPSADPQPEQSDDPQPPVRGNKPSADAFDDDIPF
jgi:single-strand DNA-binding protein